MTAPGRADLLFFFEDDEVDTRFSQTGAHRKTSWTGADDSNGRLLHLILRFGSGYRAVCVFPLKARNHFQRLARLRATHCGELLGRMTKLAHFLGEFGHGAQFLRPRMDMRMQPRERVAGEC
jgi:hypothetical protein